MTPDSLCVLKKQRTLGLRTLVLSWLLMAYTCAERERTLPIHTMSSCLVQLGFWSVVDKNDNNIVLKGKVASIVTFGAICSTNNSYLDYLINSVVRCRRVQIIGLKYTQQHKFDRPDCSQSNSLLQWDTIARLTGSYVVCVVKPDVHLQPKLGPHQRLIKPHSHRYFRKPFSPFCVQICTLANHPQQHLLWSSCSPELSLNTACLVSAIMQCQICSASNLYASTWIINQPIKIQFQTLWSLPDIFVTKETRLAPPEYYLEEMLRHEETRDEQPSDFILHTAPDGTSLGARASKASPAAWLRPCAGRCFPLVR